MLISYDMLSTDHENDDTLSLELKSYVENMHK